MFVRCLRRPKTEGERAMDIISAVDFDDVRNAGAGPAVTVRYRSLSCSKLPSAPPSGAGVLTPALVLGSAWLLLLTQAQPSSVSSALSKRESVREQIA